MSEHNRWNISFPTHFLLESWVIYEIKFVDFFALMLSVSTQSYNEDTAQYQKIC